MPTTNHIARSKLLRTQLNKLQYEASPKPNVYQTILQSQKHFFSDEAGRVCMWVAFVAFECMERNADFHAEYDARMVSPENPGISSRLVLSWPFSDFVDLSVAMISPDICV